MPALNEPKLISGNANKNLAKAITRRMTVHRGLNVDLVDARIERFNDQEIFVEVFENVRGEDMFIIQSTSNPANDNLMELLIMVDALRRSSASRITAVIPYFGYARQDRRSKARTPISAKLVANLLVEAGVERILTLDLHATQIQGFFDIPVDNLYAAPVFALDIIHQFSDKLDDLMVVSPDVGGVARARELAKRINAPLSIVDKRRERAGEVAEMTIIGDVTGKKCIIVDDICDTAGTLCKAAEVLIENGAAEVHSYITHGVLSGPAVDRISNSALAGVKVQPNFGSQDIETTGNIDLSDSTGSGNNRIKLGTGDDLELYHNGTRSEIINNTGDLIIQASANNNLLLRAQTGETHFKGVHNGQTELYYDGSRKLTRVQKYRTAKQNIDGKVLNFNYTPVPYNINYSLYAFTATAEGGLQIVEQIVPFFQPDYTVTVNIIPDLDIKRDVPIVLNSINYEDSYDGSFTTRRAVIYTMNFTAKTYLFGPDQTQKTIKTVQVDMYSDTDTTNKSREERITVQPNPTTADFDDDFGFTTTIENFTDSKNYDSDTDSDV